MKILNKHDCLDSPNAIYVGRPSPWGNPFEIKANQSRDTVCSLFEEWALSPEATDFRTAVRTHLAGHDLLCWCAPKRCHAETLRKIALSENDDALFRKVTLVGL